MSTIFRHSDNYLFCCLARGIETLVLCLPEADAFSSCEDLLRIRFLSYMTWILGISALLGNSFVIFWRVCPRSDRDRGKTKAQSILVTNLAIADGMMGVYMLIIASADVFYKDMYAYYAEAWQTSAICKIAGFLAVLSSESSVFFMTVISIDRVIAVTAPFSRMNLGSKSVKIAVLIVWSCSLMLSLMPVLVRDYFGNAYYGRSTVCLALPLTADRPAGWQYSVALFLGVNCFAFSIMAICYTTIYIIVKRSGRSVTHTANRSGEIQLAIRMAFLVITDLCCWMPVIIMGLLALTTDITISSDAYVWTAVFVLPLNSSLNPYLYTIVTRETANRGKRKSRYGQTVNSTSGVVATVSGSVDNNGMYEDVTMKGKEHGIEIETLLSGKNIFG